MPAPMLDGVTLPMPASHTLQLVPVSQDVQLADGSIVRYHRGHRTEVSMRWRKVSSAVRDQLVALMKTRGPTQFVDIDGIPYVVLVEESSGVDAVAATDPVRYDVGLTVRERRPR